ncbi:hypothetical protein ABFX02_10G054350 [Erythranthe guttata]|nr:PREDICTED: uncharacterized protein LOC105960083 [Erythranthe guttata]|eukprot:XP_012839708.1 PREDICTED: uncharacterized protein LOC105960083 [Erythranthe guttata]
MANMPPPYVEPGEFHFLKIMAEEIEKHYVPGSTFREESQNYVFRKFRVAFGPFYSDRFLKSRFKHLRKRYQDFSDILSHEGVHWNKEHNLLYGNQKVLTEKCKSHFKNGRYNGEPHFELMSQIFGSGIKYLYI